MNRIELVSRLFRTASSITDAFPRAGSKFLDMTLLPVAGSDMLSKMKLDGARRIVGRIQRFEKILIVSDLNIGDALFSQAAVSGLRDYFPDSQMDLAISKKAERIVGGNPEINNVLPVFAGTPIPSANDLAALAKIATRGKYDFLLSLCPYFGTKDFSLSTRNVVPFDSFAAVLVNAMRKPLEMSHVVYQLHRYIHLLLGGIAPQKRKMEFKGLTATIPESSMDDAREHLRKVGIGGNDKIIMLNPDASTRFTRIPHDIVVQIIKRLLRLKCPILLGSGFGDGQLEKMIMESLSIEERKGVISLKSNISLEEFSALIDFSDVYICGDSGPMHIAAARRRSDMIGAPLRNRTAVYSIFGATPAKTYAYDSYHPGYFPSNQHADSRTYVATSPCRNITCINKNAKTCRTTRCFEFVDVDSIVDDIENSLTHEWERDHMRRNIEMENRT